MKQARIVSVCLAALLLCTVPLVSKAEPVRISSGLVEGSEAEGVIVYRGIPYAAPPVGELRWKPPQPVKPWEGVRACTQFGPACPQPKPLMGPPPANVSEDCLYLNVWTPADRKKDEKLAVMVWIHGGGFTTGRGGAAWYDGRAFAQRGVVLVTINYRLGPFGFFAHPLLSKESERNVSGNYGFLDQIAALEWVRDNIAAFGGDPGCVTIFGESAGSAAVCRHMVSPLSKGLFHRAIAESAGAHGRNRHLRETWSGLEPMEKVGERLARALGCDQAKDPLAALRAKSADDILQAASPAQGLFGKGIKFGPVIDGWVLPDNPVVLFEEGKQCNVPFMVGTNADEATIFLRQLPVKRVAGYRWLVRRIFRDKAEEVLRLFPAESDEDVPRALNRLFTAGSFVAPARFLAEAMEKINGRAYLYHFTRVPPIEKLKPLGAFHAMEIPYVFGLALRRPWATELDRSLSDAMCSCWARFAATGDPNGGGLPEWPVYRAATDEYMEFGDEIRVRSGLYKEACELFLQIHAARVKNRTVQAGRALQLHEEQPVPRPEGDAAADRPAVVGPRVLPGGARKAAESPAGK